MSRRRGQRRRTTLTFLSLGFVAISALTVPAVSSVAGADAKTAVASLSSAPAVARPPSLPAVSEERPLLIVLDVSGSMEEEDGNGTIKLAGAQNALVAMIRNQRPGTSMGLWTYPNDDGCGSGKPTIPVGPLDQTTMIRAVRGLSAAGKTPTGPALLAAIDDLEVNGDYEGATILLISDGEYTCGDDPCTVVDEVMARGFDLVVETAGFRIDDDGAANLRCISEKTGGSYHPANDSEELQQVVEDATSPVLGLELSGVPVPSAPAGSAARITATVENTGVRDIENAQVTLTSELADSSDITAAVLPPRLSLGNIPSGQSASHTWLVALGTRGKEGTLTLEASAWGANVSPSHVTQDVELVDSAQALDDAGHLITDLVGERIAILGDSYSSGEGGGDYFDGEGTWQGRDVCHKSPHTYLAPLFPAEDVELIACSGATTRDVKDQTNGVLDEQVDLLGERQDEAGPVAAAFMSIGGNDIRFAEIIKRCAFQLRVTDGLAFAISPLAGAARVLAQYGLAFVSLNPRHRCADDSNLTTEVAGRLATLPDLLRPTYERVYEELNSPSAYADRDQEDPAALFIVGYPQVFAESQWNSWCPFFDGRELTFANDLVDKLNATIESTVDRMRRSKGYRIHFVRNTQEAFLPDNTACARPGNEPFVNSLDFSVAGKAVLDTISGGHEANEYLHPNASGYAAETDAILSWSVAADELDVDVPPAPRTSWTVPTSDPWFVGVLQQSADVLQLLQPAAGTVIFDAGSGRFLNEPVDVRAGQELEIEVRGAAPGSQVSLSVSSRTRVIGDVAVGEDGSGRGVVRVPSRMPQGQHRLAALGFAADGSSATAMQAIDVERGLQMRTAVIALATLIAWLGAGWFYWRQRRRNVVDPSAD